MKVSVIVPCHNSARHLRQCLSSLWAQSCPAHEVVVVDDASTDGSAAIAEEFQTVWVRRHTNGGAGVARADGAARATGDVLAFLDSDCVAPENWIETLVREFQADSQLGGLGGRYTHLPSRSWMGRLSSLEESYVHHVFSQHRDEAIPPGGNCAYLKRVWDAGRSERELSFFAGMGSGEDSVVGYELRQLKKVKFLPELEVCHQAREGKDYFRRHYNRGISRSTILLNGLSDGRESDLTFKAFGGWRLLFSGLFFLAGVVATSLALAAGSLGLLAAAGVFFGGQGLLARDFYQFARAHNRALPGESQYGAGFWCALPALLVARSACWGAGAFVGASRYAAHQARRNWNIVCSVLHFWRPGRISKLFYFVTSQCNARCEFCFNLDNVIAWKERKPSELTLEEVKRIARNFGRLPFLTLSGGEPFLRPDLPEVIRAFHEHAKTQWVTIPTNAALTERTRRSVVEILKACPGLFLTVQISLDSMGEDHDRSRKISGGFAKLGQTLRVLSGLRKRYKNLRIQIATCYDDFNVHRMDEMAGFLRENFDYDQQMLYLIRDARVLITDKNNHLLEGYLDRVRQTEAYERRRHKQRLWHRAVRVLHTLVYADLAVIKTEKKFLRPCHATQKFATLYDDGQVTPCEILEYSRLGNIRDYDYDFYKLKEKQQVAAFHRREILDKKCNCDWMCAIPINMLYDPRTIPRALKVLVNPQAVLKR